MSSSHTSSDGVSRACARENGQDIGNILGALYLAVLFLGIINSRTVQPPCAYERTVMYRERAAGMCVLGCARFAWRLSSRCHVSLVRPRYVALSLTAVSGAVRRRYNELPFALAQCVIVSASLFCMPNLPEHLLACALQHLDCHTRR